jgi:hypothetical protein
MTMAKAYTVFEVGDGKTFRVDLEDGFLSHSGYDIYSDEWGESNQLVTYEEIPEFVEWLREQYNKFQDSMREMTGEHYDKI